MVEMTPLKSKVMAEDIRENEMHDFKTVDYVRVISGVDSGRVSANDFIRILNIISSNEALLLDSSHDMNNLGTCVFWAYIENTLPANSPYNRFSGISMHIGGHCFQMAFDTYGGMKCRGSYDSGQTWSPWV